MGDWGYEAWESDEAADWFERFWKEGGFPFLIDTVENFNETEEAYDSLRAAAYLLQTLGIVYVWPSKYLNNLKPLLDKTMDILRKMIDPPNENWAYLEMGGDRELLVQSVTTQILSLQKRRNAIH